MTLVEFLQARLDEDERIARAAYTPGTYCARVRIDTAPRMAHHRRMTTTAAGTAAPIAPHVDHRVRQGDELRAFVAAVREQYPDAFVIVRPSALYGHELVTVYPEG